MRANGTAQQDAAQPLELCRKQEAEGTFNLAQEARFRLVRRTKRGGRSGCEVVGLPREEENFFFWCS